MLDVVGATVHLSVTFYLDHCVVGECIVGTRWPSCLSVESAVEAAHERLLVDLITIVCRRKHVCEAAVAVVGESATLFSDSSRSNM